MNYLFYYKPEFNFINQHEEDFEAALAYFGYFSFKFTIYAPSKTKIPAIVVNFLLFGYGFNFHTHYRK